MSVWRALQHRNYRLWFMGQIISLMGTWMQLIAMQWLVYRLTGSPLVLGAVSFSSQIPSLLLAPVAGIVSDRFHRYKIIVITQTLSLVQAAVMALLALSGFIEIWHIFLLSAFLGCINAFDMPARQSFTIDMLEDRRDLNNAIALNSMMINAGRLVGPSVAGLVIAAVGEGLCFLLNTVSFLAVIAALLAMRIRSGTNTVRKGGLAELREGYLYAFHSPPIFNMLLLMSLISLVGLSYPVVMPVFAKEIFNGGPDTLGYLMAAVGSGAVMGAYYLATRKSPAGLEKILPTAAAVLGLSLITFSQTNHTLAGLAVLFLTGIGMILFISSTNTLIQTVVDDDKRGRIMSLYTMSFIGVAPIGSLLSGTLANYLGAPTTVLIGGFVCLTGSICFYLRLPLMKPYFANAYAKLE